MSRAAYGASPGGGPAPSAPAGGSASWEVRAADAVGDVIEFWGFKRNMGRIWAVLYLRGAGLTAAEIGGDLSLSKGAVSMLLTDLLRWGVVRRGRPGPGDARLHEAETDLFAMIGRVVREREMALIEDVGEKLEEASEMARREYAPADARARLDRLMSLARAAEGALSTFLRTANLSALALRGILGAARARGRRRQR